MLRKIGPFGVTFWAVGRFWIEKFGGNPLPAGGYAYNLDLHITVFYTDSQVVQKHCSSFNLHVTCKAKRIKYLLYIKKLVCHKSIQIK